MRNEGNGDRDMMFCLAGTKGDGNDGDAHEYQYGSNRGRWNEITQKGHQTEDRTDHEHDADTQRIA